MAILFKNNASTVTVGSPTSATHEWIRVASTDVFPTLSADNPSDYYMVTLVGDDDLEIVKVIGTTIDNNGFNVLIVKRAQEGTTAQVWPAGTRVEMRITADALNSFVPTAVQLAKDYVDATGVASTTNVGFAGVDGKTTRANAEGVVTAKDVAIGGNLADLATARGQLGPAKELGNGVDYNTVTEAGFYLVNASDSVNGPLKGSAIFLHVFYSNKGALTKNLYQIAYAYSTTRDRVFVRQYRTASKDWSSWSEILSSASIGDGIRINNGIISVPEYEGATASTSGTSGLVPPATAGQQESFLTGGGEYKPALTKISDSVSLKDSTTAASAKAVKTAYELAKKALPKSGGTISGDISVVGGITVAAPDGESEGGQILLKNGTDGSYPVVIDTTQNQIRFLSGPGGPGGVVSVDLETGKFVGNLTGKADSAHLADNTYSLAGRPWLESLYTDNPGWLIGSVDEKLRPVNTGSLKVLATDHIISSSFAYGRTTDGFYLPNGGSWFVFCILDNDISHGSANVVPIMTAGGSHITWSFNGTGYVWIGIKVL